MTDSKRIVGDYENDGVMIHPGEPVLFMATSYKQTRIQRGVYLGYVVRSGELIPQVSYIGKCYDYKQGTWVDVPRIATLLLGRIYTVRHFTPEPHNSL